MSLRASWSVWQNFLTVALEFSRLQVVGRTEVHDTYRLVRVSVHIPTCRSWNQQHFDISHWGCWQQCAIAWTMIPPASQNDGRDWKSIDHFSMLPYAWIPEDGADIFQQLILHLKANWLRICGLAEEHLARRVCSRGILDHQLLVLPKC